MRPVTLQQVARHAGVSRATASRVLNGSERVPGAGVAELVRKAAAELGYVANAQAQALARSSTGLLGLVVRDISDPYFSMIAQGIQHAARQQQTHVLLSCTEGDLGAELEAVTSFVAHRADALVLVGSRVVGQRGHYRRLNAELRRYTELGGRVAVVGQSAPQISSVVPQNEAGAAALAAALVEQGHRRFAVLAGPADLRTAVDRTTGFTDSLRQRGIEPLAVLDGDFTRDGGFAASLRLVDEVGLRRECGVCVFAVNDVMALGAMTGLRSAGLRVPEDVRVAGFDDIVMVRDHVPSLTTVALPLRRMGECATDLVLGPDAALRRTIRLTGEVRLRESTRP